MLKSKTVLSITDMQKVLLDPPFCFCDKPAHRLFTLEYGPILLCHEMRAESKIKYICGFHLHELPWQSFRKLMEQEESISVYHPELRTCPVFNFTFCLLFQVDNEYKKEPPSYPLCFCKRPVVMKKCKLDNGSSAFQFLCENADKPFVKPKCSWLLAGESMPYLKAEHPRHSYVDESVYLNNRQELLEAITKNRPTDEKWLKGLLDSMD